MDQGSAWGGDSWGPREHYIRWESRFRPRTQCSLRQITLVSCFCIIFHVFTINSKNVSNLSMPCRIRLHPFLLFVDFLRMILCTVILPPPFPVSWWLMQSSNGISCTFHCSLFAELFCCYVLVGYMLFVSVTFLFFLCFLFCCYRFAASFCFCAVWHKCY